MRQFILILCLTIITCLPSLSAGEDQKKQSVYTEPVTGMQFVLIPGGTFVMGDEHGAFSIPVHQVSISPFYMSKYEVTFAQYDQYCDEVGRAKPDDQGWGRGIRPVINVNWHEAVAFAQWLSKKTGKSFRLPSEAEWEYAARGGLQTRFPWGKDLGRGNANCRGCGSLWDDKQTAAVGSFSPNGYGLFDTSGNVYEWTLDTEHRDYTGAPDDGSAWLGGAEPDWFITRGGSWNTRIVDIMSTRRCWDKSDYRSNNVGFRLVMEK